PAEDRLAVQPRRRKSVRRPAVAHAGFALRRNLETAKGDSECREVENEQRQSGEVAGHGAFARKERRIGENSRRLHAHEGVGGCSETTDSLEPGSLHEADRTNRHSRLGTSAFYF